MRELIKVRRTLSDKVRLCILKILQEGDELCVCEIMQALDISQTRASRNLGILRNAGIVTGRRGGV
ncbi:MAG: winged helix-turn-helix transcriptional regulator [Acidobacteria bacterium]|nr:winged helix-turn-helix transcriptional regulator [Acidobacteriota bacterium]